MLRRGVTWEGHKVESHPDAIRSIHADYVAAGCDLITTNTFRTSWYAMERSEYRDSWATWSRRAVTLARRAARYRAWVLGSVTTLEDCYRPDLVPDLLQWAAEPAEVLRAYVPCVQPEGRFILSLPNREAWTSRAGLQTIDFEAEHDTQRCRHRYSRAEAVQLVEAAGLEVLRVDLNPLLLRAARSVVGDDYDLSLRPGEQSTTGYRDLMDTYVLFGDPFMRLNLPACDAADFDKDRQITVADIMQVANHWDTEWGDWDTVWGDGGFDRKYDLDDDGDTDIVDVMRVAALWDAVCEVP